MSAGWNEEIASFIAKFRQIDKDGSGSLSRKEVKQCLKTCGFNDSYISDFIKTFDLDGDGNITLVEYQRVLNIVPVREREQAVWRSVFNDLDTDKSGSISIDELVLLMTEMGYEAKAGDLRVFISTNDLDKDGELSLTEFLTFMSRC